MGDSAREERKKVAIWLRMLGKEPKSGLAFGLHLLEQPFILSKETLAPVVGWLKRASGGERVTVVSVVCPDYATREENGRRIYDFNNLNQKVGLVAETALREHGKLHQTYVVREWSWNIGHALVMADQEANEANCARVKLTRDEFIACMRQSQKKLGKALVNNKVTNHTTPFLTELNTAEWEKTASVGEEWLSRARAEFVSRLNGDITRAVKTVIQHRRDFYERWAGWHLDEIEVTNMAFAQATEYVRVGAYLAKIMPNPFILGADAPCMAPFMRAGAGPSVPVLYLERADY